MLSYWLICVVSRSDIKVSDPKVPTALLCSRSLDLYHTGVPLKTHAFVKMYEQVHIRTLYLLLLAGCILGKCELSLFFFHTNCLCLRCTFSVRNYDYGEWTTILSLPIGFEESYTGSNRCDRSSTSLLGAQ